MIDILSNWKKHASYTKAVEEATPLQKAPFYVYVVHFPAKALWQYIKTKNELTKNVFLLILKASALNDVLST